MRRNIKRCNGFMRMSHGRAQRLSPMNSVTNVMRVLRFTDLMNGENIRGD